MGRLLHIDLEIWNRPFFFSFSSLNNDHNLNLRQPATLVPTLLTILDVCQEQLFGALV